MPSALNSASAPSSIVETAVGRLLTDAATARSIINAVAESFATAEIAAAAFEEPDGRWSIAIHFRNRSDEPPLRALIAAVADDAAADALVIETLAPADWVRKGQDGLEPVEAGRFAVYGAYHAGRVRLNRIGVQIEAALAFGTGHHGTTRGCLLALDRIAKEQTRGGGTHARARGKRPGVLDIGTGTGVLALASAKALRRPVLASDIDARAVRIARENAQINGVAAFVELIHAAGLGARRFRQCAPFALVFANIVLEPLQRLATPISRLVAPNGRVVLSGLLSAQAATALACYRARGLILERRINLEGWTTLVLVRSVVHAETRRRPAHRRGIASARRHRRSVPSASE
jgi:ribosomal protein L11 methyltransferase